MARNIEFEQTGNLTGVEITLSGFNDGVIDQFEDQKITTSQSMIVVKSNNTSASVIVNGNPILIITDVGYCLLNGSPINDFADVPSTYANYI